MRATIFTYSTIIVAHATIICYVLIMGKKLGLDQHTAWATFITRHAKVFRLIEKELENKEGLLPLHLYDVLLPLKKSPDNRMRLNELAEETVTSKSALSRAVDKLEKLQYLKKEKDAEDGRGQWATITSKGLKALETTWPHYEAAIHKHFGQYLTSDDAKKLTEIIRKLPFSSNYFT